MSQQDEDRAYQAGRFGTPHAGDHWDAYTRGKNDAARDAQARGAGQRQKPKPRDENTAGSAAILVGLLLLVAGLTIALFVVAATAAVPAALILLVALRLTPAAGSVSYGSAWKTSLIALAAILIPIGAVAAGSIGLAGGNYGEGLLDDLSRTTAQLFRAQLQSLVDLAVPGEPRPQAQIYPFQERQTAALKIVAALILLLPGTLLGAGVLVGRIGEPFRGIGGYLRGCAMIVLVYLPCIAATLWLLTVLLCQVLVLTGQTA